MQRIQGFAEQGNQNVFTAGHESDTLVQGSFPYATVTVFLTGTTVLATLFADNQTPPTPLANPFTADANGHWFFYAADGRYDVRFSGMSLLCPWTMGDILIADPSSHAGEQYFWSQDVLANGFNLIGAGNLGAHCVLLNGGSPVSLCGSAGNLQVSAAKVGINTATPDAMLSVNGMVRVSDENPPSTAGKGIEIGYNPASTWGGIENYNYDAGTYEPMYLQGSVLLLNHPGLGGVAEPNPGFVGVRTDTPHAALEVAGEFKVSDRAGNTGGKGIEIGYDTTSTWGGIENYNYDTGNYEPLYLQGSILLLNHTGAGGAALPNPGFVGIANDNPQFRLDVGGDCNITGQYRVNGVPLSFGGTPGGSDTQIQINSNGAFGGSPDLTWADNKLTANGEVRVTGEGSGVTTGRGVEIGFNPATGWAGMENYNYDTSAYEPLYLQGSVLLLNHPGQGGNALPSPGFVGIATDNPQFRLDCAGDINIQGASPVYRINGVPLGAASVVVSPALNSYSNVQSALTGMLAAIQSLQGGAGGAAGSSGQIQFNAANVLAASPNLAYDSTNARLEIAAVLRVKDPTLAGVLRGVEIGYNPTTTWGGIENYNYVSSTFEPVYLQGSMVLINHNSKGNVGIGTGNPSSLLTVVNDNNPTGHGIDTDRYSDDPAPPAYFSWKSRGTQASPQPIQAGDELLYIGFGGNVSGFSANQGMIAAYAMADTRAADIVFYTNDGTALTANSNGYERARITHDGRLTVGPNAQVGIELGYNQTSTWGGIENYNYSTSTYEPAYIQGSMVILNHNSHGNVGVNTINPQYGLEVNGTFAVDDLTSGFVLPWFQVQFDGRVFMFQNQAVGPCTVSSIGMELGFLSMSSHQWCKAGYVAINDVNESMYMFMAGSGFASFSAGMANNMNFMCSQDIVFHVNTTPPLSGEIMRLTASGRVGIVPHGNVANPLYQLDVLGDINIQRPGATDTYSYRIAGVPIAAFLPGSVSGNIFMTHLDEQDPLTIQANLMPNGSMAWYFNTSGNALAVRVKRANGTVLSGSIALS